MHKLFLASTLIFTTAYLSAEEGMWTFNGIPTASIKQNYDVELSQAWAEHVQKSCLRVSLGGSASFVSDQGLILTNHHVGAKAIYNLSTKEQDLMANGFLAKSLDQEIKCPNMYVDQLVSIQDVTAEVNGSATITMTTAERETARKSMIAKLSKQAQDATGLQPEVVSLYQGARYHLYLYERYTDIRLVMAPEKGIASFGGDIDNFEYPRYNLDACFFRAYKDGKPVQARHYLKWSENGPEPLEPLFVAGHPGKTSRMLTSAHLQFLKDTEISLMFGWLQEKRQDLLNFANTSAEAKRISAYDFGHTENFIKVMRSYNYGLANSSIIQNKQKEELALYKTTSNEPWTKLQVALEKVKPYYPAYLVLEGSGSSYGKLYTWAKHLVRLAAEKSKPNEERLKEYTDSELAAIELSLFSQEPVYKDLDQVNLTLAFKRVSAVLGSEHPVTKLLISAQPLDKRASSLLASTNLHDLDYRKELYENLDKVQSSSDPLILMAKAIDPYARGIRKNKEDDLDSVQNESYTEIAKVLFDRLGESVYPDATFTLRLSVGSMRGYYENDRYIEPMTTIDGAFNHAKVHNFEEPYNLPKSWLTTELALKKTTPFNFVSTNDIIGGNSGSPVINQKGELVGLIFDGNVQSLTWSFGFSDTQGRATSVHSEGIIEALKTVYGADNLVQEIRKLKL